MSRGDDLRLEDIREACLAVEALVGRGQGAFARDPAVRLAIERLLEIIGEAANALDASTTAEYPDVPWRDITRLRIVLAHHYHRVDPSQVWTIATTEIPQLLKQLRQSASAADESDDEQA